MIRNKNNSHSRGFTIVELIVVIAVIGILAAIGYVMYGGAQERAREGVLSSDLSAAAELIGVDKVRNGQYPEDISDIDNGNGLPASADTTYQYVADNTTTPPTFCLTGINGQVAMFVTESTTPKKGTCPSHHGPIADGEGGDAAAIADGSYIQDINTDNCPSDRVRAVDARDNHTYWVQKLADDKCWMLTNLAYAGGGNNTYSDINALQNGTNDTATTYTQPKYYIVPGTSNYTIEPTNPSVSTTGIGQYGYLYNWCGAMGGQVGTAACMNATTPTPNANISVCPSGWRLPTGDMSGELRGLVIAENGETANPPTGLLNSWLAQYSGFWYGSFNGPGKSSFVNQDSYGYYWSSTQNSTLARNLQFDIGLYGSTIGGSSSIGKFYGYAVRCIAAS